VSDRRAEWSISGSIGINMDPLVIVGGVGEQIYVSLCHLAPLASPQVGSTQFEQV
jgi:hypothetical protein